MSSRRAAKTFVLIAVLALFATACSTDSGEVDSAAASEGSEASESSTEPSDVPETEPAIVAGAVGTGEVTIDGTALEYAVNVPDGFETGDEAPLLLAFPGGGQPLEGAAGLVEGTLSSEAERLGWVVVSPAAPDGVRFFDGSEELIPGFLDWVETWVTPTGGAPHVLGPSNGGISSFRYALANPDRVQSVTVFPGFPRGDDDRAALDQIVDIPIRLYAGETDTTWVENAQTTLDALTELGATDVELTVFEGEGHVPASTRDGVILFEELESFR